MKKQLLIPIFIMGVLTNAQQKVNKEELQKIAIEEQAIYEEAKSSKEIIFQELILDKV